MTDYKMLNDPSEIKYALKETINLTQNKLIFSKYRKFWKELIDECVKSIE